MDSSSRNGLLKVKTPSGIPIESGSTDTRSSRDDIEQIGDVPRAKRIILRRAGMWTGTLSNGLELTNTRLYQDTNPANSPDYYVGIGESYVFNVTKGELIDLRTDSKMSVIVWPQGGRSRS
jgi:hypothetical protein